MLAFYSNYHEVKAMRLPRVPAEEQYRLIMECRKSNSVDIPDKNPVSAYVPADPHTIYVQDRT